MQHSGKMKKSLLCDVLIEENERRRRENVKLLDIGTEYSDGGENNSEGDYIVDDILGHRDSVYVLGSYDYLLKWTGFEDPSWVEESDMGRGDMLREYKLKLGLMEDSYPMADIERKDECSASGSVRKRMPEEEINVITKKVRK